MAHPVTGRHDLIVVGAGPAGTAAAIEAAARGLDTLLIDEAPAAGGQVYRAPQPHAGADHQAGAALRAALAASAVTAAFAHRVWLIEPGFTVHAIGPEGPITARSQALILATGAIERFVPIPGWTLPGVIGLAGATVLLKSQAMLPGRRVVVAGSGPLLALVAAGMLKAGGEVAAVVDAAPRAAWIAGLPGLLSRPDLVARGAGWIALLMSRRVPILSGHALSRIAGSDGVERAFAVPLDRSGAPRADAVPREIACDAVCYGHGLLPCTQATRLLGVAHDFAPDLGGWTPRIDADQRTLLPLLYAAGDGAGVLGAAAAPLRGRLAALAALHDLGRLDRAGWQAFAAPLHRDLARASRFSRALAAAMLPRAGTMALTTPETIVCRCEGIDRATIDRAIADGAATMNDVKAATRCGMGPCGGRVCADAAAALIAAGTGRKRDAIAEPTARPPLRPVPLAALAGDFNYDDLPIPAPSPL